MLCPSRSTWVRFATPTKDIGTDPDRFPLLFQSDYTLRHWLRRHLAYWRIISSFVPSQMALCCAQRGRCSAPDGHPPDTLGKIGILVSFRKSNGERLICLRRADITETYDQRQLTADDFLFRRQGAQLPMTPTTFTYRFKLILKKNGLPQGLNVHSLRHTAASLMIAGGTDVATVAGILGHSQPSTTLDIYTHAFDKNKKAASAGLQGMLEI